MKHLTYFILIGQLFLSTHLPASGSDPVLDSLKNQLKSATNDTVKVRLRAEIGERGWIFRVSYWDSIVSDAKKYNLKRIEAGASNNLAYIFENQGQVKPALKYYLRGLQLNEALNDTFGIAKTLNNLAYLYFTQGETEQALETYDRSLNLKRKLGNTKSTATTLSSIGYVYTELEDYQNGAKYHRQSLKLRRKIQDTLGIATSLNNLGFIEEQLGNYDAALEKYLESLALWNRIQDTQGKASTLINIGYIYMLKGDYDQSLEYALKGKDLADQEGFPSDIKQAAGLLYEIAKHKEDYKQALSMYELFVQMKDSISNIENQRATIRSQMRYEYEKQKAIDDKENEKRIAIEKEKQHQQFIVIVFTVSGAFIVIVLLLIIYRRLQITKKQKVIIEDQKEEVETQRDHIGDQKNIIEEKHSEIQQSINYARRIQTAILPPATLLNKYLPQHFVLYRPKDVVAGDFYWLEHHEDITFFAVADCTGHGVPGAMVSVVCHSALNRCIREYRLENPAKILDKTRELVIKTFEKSEEQVKDGMDISLCALNTTSKTLEWAGANNPIYLIRSDEVEVIKGDKEPIGYVSEPTPFTNHLIDLSEVREIVLFSDGYADQFGGMKDKKYGYKKMRRRLLEWASLPLEDQKIKLNTEFDAWLAEGNTEQIDDVCVLGVKL